MKKFFKVYVNPALGYHEDPDLARKREQSKGWSVPGAIFAYDPTQDDALAPAVYFTQDITKSIESMLDSKPMLKAVSDPSTEFVPAYHEQKIKMHPSFHVYLQAEEALEEMGMPIASSWGKRHAGELWQWMMGELVLVVLDKPDPFISPYNIKGKTARFVKHMHYPKPE